MSVTGKKIFTTEDTEDAEEEKQSVPQAVLTLIQIPSSLCDLRVLCGENS